MSDSRDVNQIDDEVRATVDKACDRAMEIVSNVDSDRPVVVVVTVVVVSK